MPSDSSNPDEAPYSHFGGGVTPRKSPKVAEKVGKADAKEREESASGQLRPYAACVGLPISIRSGSSTSSACSAATTLSATSPRPDSPTGPPQPSLAHYPQVSG